MPSVETINTVANLPSVLPFVAPGHDSVDLAEFFDDPRNLAFGDERGVIMVTYTGDGAYEWHWLLTPEMAGREALHFARSVLLALFTKHGAVVIYGVTPRDNRAARVMNRALGAVPTGTETDVPGRPCIRYEIRRDKWASFSKV